MSKPWLVRPGDEKHQPTWGAYCDVCGKAWWEDSESLARQMREDHGCSEQDMKARL